MPRWAKEVGAFASIPTILLLSLIFGDTEWIERWSKWTGNVLWDDNT